MPLMGLIAISGIFGSKNEDLDILPPPPPFPDIGIDKKPNAAEEAWKRSEQKKEQDRKKKLELEAQKVIEKNKKEEQIKKQKEMQKRLQEKEEKFAAKREKTKLPELISGVDKEMAEFSKLEQKKSFFGNIFGKKDEELEKELEELEEIRSEPRIIAKKPPELTIPKAKVKSSKIMQKAKLTKPLQDISQVKFPKLEFEKGINLSEMEKDEEEIKKAIDGMKEKSRTPSISRLFKRKEDQPKESDIFDITCYGKIETPEVMPRTFDKIDHVQEIEERIHKARMHLMDFKFDDSKRIYLEIMNLYNILSQKDKYKVYQDIRDLYYERKSAEKFAK